jgi:transposase-like protein
MVFDVPYQLPDLELMLLDRGVEVDHTIVFRRIEAYAIELGEANPAAPADE